MVASGCRRSDAQLSRVRSLDVYLGDELVAEVGTPRSGKMTLAYKSDVIDRVGIGGFVLSAALPARVERYSPTEATSFLDGLLPLGWARAGLEQRFDVHRVDSFSLLAAVGRECAGAVSFVPSGDPWPTDSSPLAKLDDSEITSRLTSLDVNPFGVDDATRVTLAGTCWKLPLCLMADGGWASPVAGMSSTHIFRPEPPDFVSLATTEAYSLAVLRLAGISVVHAEVATIVDRSVLVVTRFDREIAPDGAVIGIHQEDCSQALGAATNERTERDGGPSLSEIADLVRDMSASPEVDLIQLLSWLVACVVFGKVDGTATDLALTYRSTDDFVVECRLAPVASMAGTADYPNQPTQLAMSIGGIDELSRIRRRHLEAEAVSWGMPHSVATDVMDDLLEQLHECLDTARRDTDPGDDVVAACRARLSDLMTSSS